MRFGHKGFIFGGIMHKEEDFKFDVIRHSSTDSKENVPKYFLADTIEEAEELFKSFSSILNHLAYNFAISTGLQKADFFGEGIIGLGKAREDWNPARSEFKSYAIFRIKDAMMEFVRENHTIVRVPSYIKKANANLKKVISFCERFNVDYRDVLFDKKMPEYIDKKQIEECLLSIEKISAAAKRANVDYQKFVERIMYIPKDTELSDIAQEEETKDNRPQEILEAEMIVNKLKKHMDEIELFICQGIMADKTYEEIGKELGHSKSWVYTRLMGFRKKIENLLKRNKI